MAGGHFSDTLRDGAGARVRGRTTRCWACGDSFVRTGDGVVCLPCRTAPPAWMIASAAFVAEQRGDGA